MQIQKNLYQYKRDTYTNVNIQTPQNTDNLPTIHCNFGSKCLWNLDDIINEIENLSIQKISAYPKMSDINLLKETIIKKYNNKKLTTDNIFLGHGTFNILERIIHKLVNPKKMIGVGPQFNEIPSEFVSTGGKYFSIPLIENNFSLDKVYESIKNELYDVLYIDNPNNPTGFVFNIEDISKLAQICDKTGTILIIDEAYGDFLDNNMSSIQLINTFQNIIVVRSFSKGFCLPSIRSGYMITSNKIAKIYKEIDVPFEPSYISIKLSLMALNDKILLNNYRDNTIDLKKYIIDKLSISNIFILPTNPNIPIFMLYSENKNLYNYFLSINILTVGGESFKNTYSKLDNSYVRMHIPNSIDEAKQIISRIENNNLIQNL
ncbi:aminotransferase class I/II-fold pyridoxal phosphate-dependent enzyme [Patescibacteria group bacterium]|nr:aminotransferase class I/II-fold pyridoxal phosphate-dependent enzyme [Patescibacteria group bacterium]